MNRQSAVGELATRLIALPSVTPDDAGCLEVLEARLACLGFDLVRLPSAGVDNLWAVRGSGGACFAFAGHTDVVPAGDPQAWSHPPFTPTIVDDLLYGRGAADMKGSLAAMVVAVEQFVARHPEHPGRIGFILTSDEEGPATDGTVKIMEYLERMRIGVDWCVVGEPSSAATLGDTIRVGRRGSLNGRLLVHGTQGHVAYPDRADNPIQRALPALAELAERQWDEGNDFYPPTSFQISNLQAGTGAENVIPQTLEAWFNFRFCTEQTADALRAAVEAALNRHGLRYELEWKLSGQPFLTAGGRLVETVRAVVEECLEVEPELSTGGGTSDGRFIAPYGVELVELGPCNASIHKIDECVSVRDLERLSEVYERILERMLIGARGG
ncbi:MAG: succinyl-diaminopimelate desuccinylase [Gammaproteobacteria bacterium]